MTTTRKRHQVSAFTEQLARLIDAEMARQRPRVTRAMLARDTKIEPSAISKMLKPSKPMLAEELAAICKALGLSVKDLIEEAERQVVLSGDRPAPGASGGGTPADQTPPASGGSATVPARPAHEPSRRPHGASGGRNTRRRGSH